MLLSSELFHHACKTPLSILLCNLETALEVENGSTQAKTSSSELVEQSFQAARKLKVLLKHINDPNQNTREVFDVAVTTKEVGVFIRAKFQPVTVVCRMPNALITGNKLYFEEALQCLLVNAVEAQADSALKSPVVIVHGEVLGDDALRVDIIDFGKGMTPAERKLALLKGVTYKEAGTGLGLPFAVETIRHHFNGSFRISSRIGIGTRITLEIPL